MADVSRRQDRSRGARPWHFLRAGKLAITAALLVIMLGIDAAAQPVGAAGAATVSLSSTWGRAGARVWVRGRGFPGGAAVWLLWGQDRVRIGRAAADRAGSFDALIQVPKVATGGYTLTVEGQPQLRTVPPPPPVTVSTVFDVTDGSPPGTSPVLLFREEFNGASLDASKWHTCFWWASETCTIETNNELELYVRENVQVANGLLRLRAQRGDAVGWNGKTYPYTSGMVMTGGRKGEKQPGFAFRYGYAEARIKVPRGQGLWPAFWMLPVAYTWPPEIDVMEINGAQPRVHSMHHHWTSADGQDENRGASWTGPDFSANWHRFGVDWRPDALVWYVDGVERWRSTERAGIPTEPMYLVLNLAVGGNWPGSPNEATPFPSYLEVDYVRVYSTRPF